MDLVDEDLAIQFEILRFLFAHFRISTFIARCRQNCESGTCPFLSRLPTNCFPCPLETIFFHLIHKNRRRLRNKKFRAVKRCNSSAIHRLDLRDVRMIQNFLNRIFHIITIRLRHTLYNPCLYIFTRCILCARSVHFRYDRSAGFEIEYTNQIML